MRKVRRPEPNKWYMIYFPFDILPQLRFINATGINRNKLICDTYPGAKSSYEMLEWYEVSGNELKFLKLFYAPSKSRLLKIICVKV